MPQRIQLRRGTASEWGLANPVLAAGEFGVEHALGADRIKVGDGTSTWAELSYFATGPSSLTAADIPFVPVGTIGSTNLQTALAEVASEGSAALAAESANRISEDDDEAAARTAAIAALATVYVHATGGGLETVATVANAGTAVTLDLADANVFVVENPAAGGTCVLTLTGATTGRSCGGTLYFHQRASGDSALAFAGGTIVHMNDGDLPGPAQVADAVSVYGWATLDGGATIYVWKVGDSGTVAPPAVPDAPTAVVGTRGNAQVSVAFTPGAANGSAITGYTVTASPGGATATGASSPIVVTGLANGTPYTFTVHATNSIGDSAESSPSAAVTPATVPGAPTAVVGTPGNTSASIAFSAPGSNGGAAISGYTATLSPGGATFSGASSPISATGLTNGTAYTATVHATNAVGNSVESTASAAFTPAASASVPGAPTIGTATAGDTTATVTWTAGSNGGSAITDYQIKTYDSSGTLLATDLLGGTGLTFTKTGLTNGTAVKFKVAAINAIGTGAQTAFSNTVTPAGFTPAALPNVVWWGNPQTLSAGALASWADSSAAGTTLAQTDATKQPVVQAAVLNGHPAIYFDGINDFLVSANFTVPKTQPTTALLVVKIDGDPTNTAKLIDGGGAGRQALYLDVDGATGLRTHLFIYAGSGGALGGGTVPASTWCILLVEFNGASSRVYINGGTSIAGMALSGDSDPEGRITLFCDSGQGAHFVKGWLADGVFIDGLLTVSEKNQLGAYLTDPANYPALTWNTVTA